MEMNIEGTLSFQVSCNVSLIARFTGPSCRPQIGGHHVGPRLTPCWLHELCYLGWYRIVGSDMHTIQAYLSGPKLVWPGIQIAVAWHQDQTRSDPDIKNTGIMGLLLFWPNRQSSISHNWISWMKMFDFRTQFHWKIFLWVWLLSQHWFRQWLGAEQATNQCLNQR